jgi:valyl-tRNA synthetase
VEYGRKFLTKLWNAARLIISSLQDYDVSFEPSNLELTDKWLLSKLHTQVKVATDAFENYQFNVATESTRNFIWHDLCDQYLEAVKYRLYTSEKTSAQGRRAAQFTLFHTLDTVLRLLAPVCSHISEALYNELWAQRRKIESIHLEAWPASDARLIDHEAERKGTILIHVLSELRRIKSERRLSMKAPVRNLTIWSRQDIVEMLRDHAETIRQVAVVEHIEVQPAEAGGELLQQGTNFRLEAEF